MKSKKTVQQKLGERVRQIRKNRGLSQEDLAERCNLDRTYLSGVERGLRNVSIVNIEKIAVALGIDISELTESL